MKILVTGAAGFVGGQLTDWNFELRGAQAWIADENRWDYSSVKVHLPNGDYHFAL